MPNLTFNYSGYNCVELRGTAGMSARMLICTQIAEPNAKHYFYCASVGKLPHDLKFYRGVAEHMLYEVKNGVKEYGTKNNDFVTRHGKWFWLHDADRISKLLENFRRDIR